MSVTVTGQKRHLDLNSSTLTTTGNITAGGNIILGDNQYIHIGDNPDLKIYHNGSHSFIQDQGAGDLRLLGSSIKLQSTSEENMLVATPDGTVALYHDNSVRFETAAAGAQLTGSFYLFTGNYIHFDNGVSNNYAIRKNSTNLEFKTGGSYNFLSGNVDFAGHVGIASSKYLEFHGQGKLINFDVSSWSNASAHNLVYAGWLSNLGDYLSFKVPGNSTSGHGNLIIGDNGLWFGTMNTTDSAAATDSATNPHSGSGSNYFRVDTSGNAVFSGTITASGYNDSNWNTAYTHSQSAHAPSDADATPGWVPSSDPGYLTANSTQSKYLRSDESDTTSGTVTSTSALGFKVDSSSAGRIEIESNNNWAYLRLRDNSAVAWDIATYDGGNLEFRPAGSNTNRMTYSSGGNLVVAGSVTANGTVLTGDQDLSGLAAASHDHAAGDITSGTLAVARGGTGLTANTTYINSNAFANFTATTADYDTLTTRGLYRFQGGSNGPSGTTHTTGLTLVENSGNYGWQMASHSSSNNTEGLYYRYRGTSWGPWQTLVTKTYGDGRYGKIASPTFTGTPAAPTASAGTNTTQIATTAFVSTAVSNLVDSAPGTLNTLNELAAALGDDANFSTTVTNSIATKLPLAGGTMTGDITMSNNRDIILSTGSITSDGTTFAFDGAAGKEVLISSARDVRVVIDDNDDDTDNTFEIHKHSFASGNELLTLNQSGNLAITGTVTANGTTLTGDQDLSGYMPKSGGTFTGSVTGTQFKLNNNTSNTNADSFLVYDNGSDVVYGMTLWNTNATSGEWATMIFGPNQSSRRISFGKANSNFGTNHAGIDELAWLDLDNGNYFTDGNMYPSNQTTHYVSSGRIQNWQTAYTYSQVGHLPLSGGTVTGDLTVQGVNYGLYHGESAATTESGSSSNYYHDPYGGGRHLSMFLKNARADIIRYRAIDNVEYWNGSSWQDGSSQLANVKKLLDGRQDTSWSIPSTYYKFRFTISPSTSWPTTAKVGTQTSWTGSTYPGHRMIVEEYDGSSWSTRVTAKFGGSSTTVETTDNNCDNWGWNFISTNQLHTGNGNNTGYQSGQNTRITIDFYGWSPSNNSYVTIPMQNIFITSNFSGTENTDYTNLLDYDRNITTAGAINLGHASDTTIARSAAGKVTIEGNEIYHEGHKPTYSELGAMNYSNLTGTVPTWNQDTTGNAATATSATTANSANSASVVPFSGITSKPTFVVNSTLVNRSTSAPDTAGDDRGVTFNYMNGSASPAPTGTDHALMTMAYSNAWQTQLAQDWREEGRMYVRGQENGTWSSWNQVWDSSDFSKASVLNSNVDHDALTNYVANEHIDWSAENAGTIHASNINFPNDNNTFRTIKVDTNNDGTVDATLGATENLALIGGTAITLSENAGVVTINGTAETYTAHESISAAADTDNSGNTFIQDLTLDDNGHVTGVVSAGVSIPTHDNLSGYVANEHIDWTQANQGTIHASNYVDNTGTSGISNVVEDTSPQLGAALDMNGFAMYETNAATASIDLKDHGSYTWFRNSSNVWVFQGGTASDDWTQTFALHLPTTDSSFNNKLMELGQRQNNGSSGGKYKGVRIVKSTGSSTVADGFLQAGDMYTVGGIAIGDLSDTTLTRHSAGHLETSLYRIFDDGYHPNADTWTTARTITLGGDLSGSVSINGSANVTLTATVANDSHSHSNYITSNANDTVSANTTWNDGNQARFGTGGDLKIQHNGSNAYIDNNTGNLHIRTNVDADVGGNIYIRPHDNEHGIIVTHDSDVKLYHNNSQKFATTSGGVSITGTVTASNTIGNKGTNIGQQMEYGDANVATLRCDADRWRVYFGGGGQAREAFSVLETGNAGIGDSTPSYKLDVAGTIRATGDVIAYSDKRVKENIKTIDNSLEKVNKLRGVEFNKIGEDKKSIGVIAQEIEKILPEVVRTDDEGMKSVAYGNVVGVLIEAVKELTKEVEELKKCNKCKNCNCNA